MDMYMYVSQTREVRPACLVKERREKERREREKKRKEGREIRKGEAKERADR